MAHVAIVGGGVVGLSCAVALLDAGHRVTLVDADRAGDAASWGNAGHIATEQVAPLASHATLRSVPSRLFLTGGALALPLREIATWLPFSLRLVAAAAPARFACGEAALEALLGRALDA
ncbi:FAD-dependent oxidoreductase, partial [Novosphingobium sp. 1949]